MKENVVSQSIEWHFSRLGLKYVSRSKLDKVSLIGTNEELQSTTPQLIIEPSDEGTSGLLWSTLDEVRQEALACTKCRLCETRSNVVFGSGNELKPLIAFVGEGPGEEEDKQGLPFVGSAGELLSRAITKGLNLKREDLYICNVVKCRPPENRNPLLDEVEACHPYLRAQLLLVAPQVIVTLGAPAQRALCGLPQGITKLRGNWLEWEGIPVMPTFHPAYILRNPAVKRDFWEDLQQVMLRLGIV